MYQNREQGNLNHASCVSWGHFCLGSLPWFLPYPKLSVQQRNSTQITSRACLRIWIILTRLQNYIKFLSCWISFAMVPLFSTEHIQYITQRKPSVLGSTQFPLLWKENARSLEKEAMETHAKLGLWMVHLVRAGWRYIALLPETKQHPFPLFDAQKENVMASWTSSVVTVPQHT